MARGPNQKAVAAAEKKAANQAVKDAEKARQNEARESAEWKKGSNVRAANKTEEAAAKADEAARKKKERADLLAAEEAAMGSGKAIKSKFGAASKKGGKKKDDLSLLEDALVSDAEKKAKEKKRLEKIKKEREAQLALEREQKQREEQAKIDPLMANTEAMIGMDGPNGEEDASTTVGRKANVAGMEDIQASGLDSALSKLSVGTGAGDDRHPEKRMKAAYKAFEEKVMPEMKEQYPSLKRQQYLDKIFALWKKSPENPMNQQP
ncbi:hypothetical protein ACHAXN_003380 [Cyclotella atomus]